ncbi:MAG: hypothetical protein HRU28_13465 [Rhizobiales bacterium]|nr:hypothetical protein [Hyphomicrobiales bacterium]
MSKRVNAFDLTKDQLKAQIQYELKKEISKTILVFILASLQELENKEVEE